MEQNPSKIFGLELLAFEGTEIYKVQGKTTTFLDQGTLHVLYFEEQIRFLLSLNYWDYALVQSLTVTSLNNHDQTSHSYAFPASDGFFILKITKPHSAAAIQNFETILKSSTKFHHEGEEASGMVYNRELIESLEEGYPESSLDSQKLSAMGLIKKGITKVTDTVKRTLTKSHKENLNMKEVKDIDSLKSSSRDFLTTHEFSKDDIENAVNRSKDFSRLSETIQAQGQSHMESLSFETKNQNKTKIEQEIEKHRRMQEEARILQEEHKRKEEGAIQRERELELLLLEKQRSKKIDELEENILQAELEKKTKAVQEEQDRLEAEHQEYERREQELIGELHRRINELKSKDRMTENELSELTQREQELILSTQRLDTEKRILEKKIQALTKKFEKQEEKLEDLDTLKVEKELLKKEEDEVRRLLSEEMRRLRRQEEMVQEEREKYNRMEAELSRIMKEDDEERQALDKAQKEFYTNYENRLEELEKQRSRIEAGKSEFEERAKSMEAEIQMRLVDLKQREDLTEREKLEVELKEGELAMITQLIKAEELKTKLNLKECWEDYKKRENEVRDHEILIEDQSKKLGEIARELEMVVDLEAKERKRLERKEQIVPKKFEDRFEKVIEQEKINEIERSQIQKQEEEGRIALEKELLALKGKELMTGAEKMRSEQIERKILEIKKVQDSQFRKTQEQLDEITQHEANLLIQNQELLKGHLDLQDKIERLEHDISGGLTQQTDFEITQEHTTSG